MPKTTQQVLTIIATLKAEIIAGTLTPDSALVQHDLAARFGVSRMPVREAIQRLEHPGFVTMTDTNRSQVAATSRADFFDIYDLRIAGEPLAMRLAIPDLTNRELDQAAALHARILEEPVGKFGALNTAFHTTLYAPCHRPRLLSRIKALRVAANRYHTMAKVGQEVKDRSNAEHAHLLDACRARDALAAETCVRDHITHARDMLIA